MDGVVWGEEEEEENVCEGNTKRAIGGSIWRKEEEEGRLFGKGRLGMKSLSHTTTTTTTTYDPKDNHFPAPHIWPYSSVLPTTVEYGYLNN